MRTLLFLKTLSLELNMTRAAQKLHLSQPSLSKFLTNEEEKLGAKIFLRRSSGLVLTPTGEKYLAHLEQVAQLEEKFFNELEKEKAHQTIVLGITPWIGSFIRSRIMKLWEKISCCELKIVEAPGEFLIHEFFNQRIHFLVSIADERLCRKKIQIKNLLNDPLYFVIPKDFLPKNFHTQGASTDQIIPYVQFKALLTGKEDQFITKRMDKILEYYHVTPSEVIRSQNMNTLLSLSESGQGYTCLPELYIKNGSPVPHCCLFPVAACCGFYERNLYYLQHRLTENEQRLIHVIHTSCAQWSCA